MLVGFLGSPSHPDDHDTAVLIIDEEQRTPITYSNPMEVAFQLLHTVGAWVLSERPKCGIDPQEDFARRAVELPLGSRKEDNLVGHRDYLPDARRSPR